MEKMPAVGKVLIPSVAPASDALRVFSLHLDFPASVRARWAANTITRLAGEHWTCSTEMWKLESLHTANSIRTMLTDEAARADVLVVAFSSLNRREFALVEWLESLATRSAKRSSPGLLIGLFGDEQQQSRELDWTVKGFMNCARRTNRDFIWHWMEEPVVGEPDWLASHVQAFLAQKLAAADGHFFQAPVVEFA